MRHVTSKEYFKRLMTIEYFFQTQDHTSLSMSYRIDIYNFPIFQERHFSEIRINIRDKNF